MYNITKMVAIFALTAGLLAGCGSSDIKKVDTPATTQAAAEAKVPEAPAEAPNEPDTHNLQVGEGVLVNDVQVTVHGVRFAKMFDDTQAAVLDVSFENKGDEPAHVSTWNFNLIDQEGVQMELGFVDEQKPEPSGEIAPGRKLRGETVFALKDVQGDVLDLTYSEMLESGQAIWQIKLQ